MSQQKQPKLLIDYYPQISGEFDETRNPEVELKTLRVYDLSDIVWKCSFCREHWTAKPINRKKFGDHKGCQACKLETKLQLRLKISGKTLQNFCPILSDELNEKREPFLNPDQISFRSSKLCWWICKDCEFPWQATVANRTGDKPSGCPDCGIKKMKLSTSISEIKKHGSVADFPKLKTEWDQDRNKVPAASVSAHNTTKYHWICSSCGWKWETTPFNRTKDRSGCSPCGHKRVGEKTSQRAVEKSGTFFDRVPYLLQEWDYEKNGDLLPAMCSPQSNKKVWWKCLNSHSWQISVAHRVDGSMCGECTYYGTSLIELRVFSELSKLFPEVEWRTYEYGFEIDVLVRSINLAIEIDGYYWHRSIKNQTRDRKKSSVLTQHFNLLRIRDHRLPDVGGIVVPSNINSKHKLIINDLMEKLGSIGLVDKDKIQNYLLKDDLINHDYFYSLIARMPAPPKGRSFGEVNPDLAEDWDKESNNGLTAFDIFATTDVEFNWICRDCGEPYRATTLSRHVNRSGCPKDHCHLPKKGNSLLEKYPKISKEWDTKRNGHLSPANVYPTSKKQVWWICQSCRKPYQWKIQQRVDAVRRNNCDNPACTIPLHGTSLAQKYPYLQHEWNYGRNTPHRPQTVSPTSQKEMWWQCKHCGTERFLSIGHRVQIASSCGKYKCKEKNNLELGIFKKTRKTKFSANQIKKVLKLSGQGKSINKISIQTGISSSSVRRMIADANNSIISLGG